ncbi:MAG: hypothetical protein KA745_03755 [Gemmatimonadales bacterium]|nr:hypothetical protein [Gemmatimonadales bacterium]
MRRGPSADSSPHRHIATYGSQELRDSLNQSGLGSHPELVRFVVRIARALRATPTTE